MSAFYVSRGTVDAILTMLQVRDGETLARIFAPFTAPEDPRDALDALGRQLLEMNVSALEARYPTHDHAADAEDAAAYTFTARPSSTGYALRQLDCLMYQCAEGDVPERPLFEALEKTRRLLADRVLEGVPAYASAPWGVPA